MNANVVLSKREAEIAELLAWGDCKKRVAVRCHIAVRTVENHVRNIYEKTGVTKVNELSAWYFCTHFNISFQLSPLLRKVTACALLLFFLSTFFEPSDNTVIRCRRCERTRTSREGRGKDEYLILDI